jgi:hypothetical protein
MTETSIEPFTRTHLDGLIALLAAGAGPSTPRIPSGPTVRWARRASRSWWRSLMGSSSARSRSDPTVWRTEGYYERLGASRSLGFRLTREDLGLDGTHTK